MYCQLYSSLGYTWLICLCFTGLSPGGWLIILPEKVRLVRMYQQLGQGWHP